MDIETLQTQEHQLVWTSFGANDALTLGLLLLDMGQKASLPVAIDIRTPDQTLFHVALPGAAPLNDLWARRKSNTVLKYHMSSLLLGEKMRANGKGFDLDGLDETGFAAHGGSFPIRLATGMVVAAVTVSGLPQIEDHGLVVSALKQLLER